MRNYFYVEDMNKTYTIRFRSLDGLPFECPSGSYNVLKARLFNEDSYPGFLRMAMFKYGANWAGRNGGYITEFFLTKSNAEDMCKELNKRLNKVLDMWEQTYEAPDSYEGY